MDGDSFSLYQREKREEEPIKGPSEQAAVRKTKNKNLTNILHCVEFYLFFVSLNQHESAFNLLVINSILLIADSSKMNSSACVFLLLLLAALATSQPR